MKMKFYFLLLLLPVLAEAQPTIQLAQDYNIGTVIRYRKCNPVAAGSSGAAQVWNFSSLVPFTTKDTLTVSYVGPGTVYPGATLLEKTSDSTYVYMERDLLADSTIAVADSSSGGGFTITFLTGNALLATRPLIYNTSFADTFNSNLLFSGMGASGTGGTRTFKVDGYGTLTLPNGTFNNVVRLKVSHSQTNSTTTPVPASGTINIQTYMWFDALHKAPLLRIDSTSITSTPSPPLPTINRATTMYLLKEDYPSSIRDAAGQVDFSAGFTGSQLLLNGNFVAGKEYEAAVFNMSGQKVFAGAFIAQANRQALHINTEIPAGMYFVLVTEKGNAANFACIKVVKE